MDLTRRSPVFTSFTPSTTSITTCLLILSLFLVEQSAARNYVHSREEIKLTGHVTIAQTNCAKNETPIFVHTAAVTEGKYFDRRMTIRKTWAREAKEANFRVCILLIYLLCKIIKRLLTTLTLSSRSSSSSAFHPMRPLRRPSSARRPPTATCCNLPSPRTTSTSH